MADVQRIQVNVPDGGIGASGHPDYFSAQEGDAIVVINDPDGGWTWRLLRSDGRLKLEQGNHPNEESARQTASDVFGPDFPGVN